ncbi:hypothetical protein GS444_24180 [Rhodococcus hoagii]|nr:hypothetical protein [Prescottella equi]
MIEVDTADLGPERGFGLRERAGRAQKWPALFTRTSERTRRSARAPRRRGRRTRGPRSRRRRRIELESPSRVGIDVGDEDLRPVRRDDRAIAAPMPCAPPVTIARLPASSGPG